MRGKGSTALVGLGAKCEHASFPLSCVIDRFGPQFGYAMRKAMYQCSHIANQ